MSKGSELFDAVTKLDHPLARKLKELHAEAFALRSTSHARVYIWGFNG
jgi:hypothetical protein